MRGIAGRRVGHGILERLGYPIEAKSGEAAVAALAAGLGQGS